MNVHGKSTTVPLPESAFSRMSRRVNAVNNRVTQITPYECTKTAYIGDTSVEFDKVKDGMINVSINGNPCDFSVDNSKVIAHFDELEEMATVTLMIQ